MVMNVQGFAEKCLSVYSQVVFMVVTTIILVAMLYKPMTDFVPIAPAPLIIPVTESLKKEWQQEPAVVKTGLRITDFSKFDALKNDFVVHVNLWFEYDPKKVTFEEIDNFAFIRGDIVKKSEPFIKKEEGGTIFVQYYLKVQFSTALDYHRFPLDDHSLYLSLMHNIPASRMIYDVVLDDFALEDSLDITGWSVVQLKAKTGCDIDHLGKSYTLARPKAIFSIDLAKYDERNLFMILLPLLFIFYLSMFALSINDFMHGITILVSTISALIAYSFVMQTMSPSVGYFMVSDYFFLSFLFLIFIVFLIILLTATDGGFLKNDYKLVRGIATPILYGALMVIWYYLTNVLYVV